MTGLTEAIRRANEEAKRQKNNINPGNTNLSDDWINAINNEIFNQLDDSLPSQLANTVKTILPTILSNIANIQKNEDDPKRDEKVTQSKAEFDKITKAIKELVDSNIFDDDLTNDINKLKQIQEALKNLNTATEQSIKLINSDDTSSRDTLREQQSQIKAAQNRVEGYKSAVNDLNKEPEDISLNTQAIKEQLQDVKNNASDFRKTLVSLFNIHATSDLSETAALFEEINKRTISANEAMEALHNVMMSKNINSPTGILAADEQIRNVRIEVEHLVNSIKQTNSSIAQSSLGDITNFYTKLLNMGTGMDVSLAEVRANINRLNISQAEKDKLEQVLNENKEQIEAMLQVSHKEFTNAFEKKINDIVNSIDKETDKVLNQFASGRELSQKYTSAFNQAGRTASSIWQIATGIEQTKDRFSAFNIGFGKPNLSAIKKDMSTAGQLQFELDGSSREFMELYDTAIQQRQKGLHKQSEATLRMANELFASIVNIQAEFSARSMRAIKKWNSLSEEEKKRLDPSGQMDSSIKNLARQVKTSNMSVIAMRENFNIKIDNKTKHQLNQLKEDTKDLTKLEQETSKAEKKTEDTLKQLTSLAHEAVNEVKSIISSTRNLFNSFGNLGIAFAGPIETIRKTYDYHKQQGRLRYAGMSTDASIGYTNLDDSAQRTQERLMRGKAIALFYLVYKEYINILICNLILYHNKIKMQRL